MFPRDPDTGLIIAAPRDRLAFFHHLSRRVAAGKTAYDHCKTILSYNPVWLRVAFWVRDRVSQLAGVQPINGFQTPPDRAPQAGGKLGFFDVVQIDDTEIVLVAPDRHLLSLTCIQLTSTGPGGPRLTIATSVETFNRFGRLYMIPVAPAHRYLVGAMLKRM